MTRIVPVVEGHGEEGAVRILIERVVGLLDPHAFVHVERPIRQARATLLRARELERVVELAAARVGGDGGILVLIDSDDDCPATFGPALAARARAARPDMAVGVVLAHREYEAWFLAAASSLAGQRGLPADLQDHPAPETKRGAKEWLGQHMPRGYSEPLDQPSFTRSFDLALAMRTRSFRKCVKEIARLAGLPNVTD